MEIIKDPSAQDDKVRHICFWSDAGPDREGLRQRPGHRGGGEVYPGLQLPLLSETEFQLVVLVLLQGFMKRIEEKGVPDDMKGKDKIVFGNIHQIYDWHRDFFVVELEKCLEDHELLAGLFIKHERRLHMYVNYCQNKPKSEYIVAEYDTYFDGIQQDIQSRLSISDFLIKPIQRITKYQLLLKDFLKYSSKAGIDCEQIEKAVDLMSQVPKLCNDMMNLGRLQGFEGNLINQGKLLQQETFFVTEQDGSVLSRSKERRVFLFEKIVIFSELLRKGSSTPGYQFKKCIKVFVLGLEESADNDPCKFVLSSRGSPERFTLQAANVDIKQEWIRHIQDLLDAQNNFLIGEINRTQAQHTLTFSSSTRPPSHLLPLCLPPQEAEGDGCNGVSSTRRVTQDYSAVKENEISVSKGETVQILASNQQNMHLVYRQADSQSPAAEGWVPGYILDTPIKSIKDSSSTSSFPTAVADANNIK
uniref:Kalirin RhoGEF kinase b n=1 Tax=Oryzias melastigma TaxID=30732 RepID=A0A3B3C163_ORYME